MAGRPRGGTADKRQAILGGALTVFARDGYARSSIDAIAAEANVSTRTIYNHFQDKATLFQVVIQESADRVAARHIELIDRYLRKVTDPEEDLVDFGLAIGDPGEEEQTHFALVRQVHAESEHIPRAAVEAWLRSGPLKVRQALASRLAGIPGLDLPDPERAALHLMRLITPDPIPLRPPTPEETRAHVTAGIRAFLYGYRRADAPA
ncbi:TetR/AcrR family transcriptional regulator [Bailinhaonella thermotolerans]|uniref:TetR/AcrR family transcriptional regulator n=1 Tax=Bailinhaonella thermotolerans TaxID=1070861 RepID=A0A3A4ASC9_9ACTN|nr:TetR/AcrR family transcriptional regulator [Bailinhaonella thermotolerans]RJL32121.1 TetR/AcrR family transcriptional regulator [Bailinhaonella thermotolerans]